MLDPAVDTETIKAAVKLACRAPSLHNSQPWRWTLEGNVVQLFADPSHVAPATDRSGRETLISCGAALDHFRVAVAAAGWTANLERFPNPNDHKHLASVYFRPSRFVTDGHRRRAEAILQRRTDRLPFAAPPDWLVFEAELPASLGGDSVQLGVIADELRPELVAASDLSESLRLYDTPYHEEIHWWTAGLATTEGIPQSSLISAAESDRVDVGRSFPVSPDSHRRAEVGEDQAKILVLSTFDDTHDSALRCGETLSAVLLDATMAGYATCTVTHLMEFPASRSAVAKLSGGNLPQVLVRVGLAPVTADTPPATPRKPIDDVFDVRTEDTDQGRSGVRAGQRHE